MDVAPIAYGLWQKELNFDPVDPLCPNRFILSASHASMPLYPLPHATKIDDLKTFRRCHLGTLDRSPRNHSSVATYVFRSFFVGVETKLAVTEPSLRVARRTRSCARRSHQASGQEICDTRDIDAIGFLEQFARSSFFGIVCSSDTLLSHFSAGSCRSAHVLKPAQLVAAGVAQISETLLAGSGPGTHPSACAGSPSRITAPPIETNAWFDSLKKQNDRRKAGPHPTRANASVEC
jgi:hypothetical protein